jgi:hypothetical protein
MRTIRTSSFLTIKTFIYEDEDETNIREKIYKNRGGVNIKGKVYV